MFGKIPSFETILRLGGLRIRLKRSGMYQIIPFRLTYEKLQIGDVPYLLTDKIIDMPELTRVCNEYNFPIIAKNGKAFPTGKTAIDFVIKKPQQAGASGQIVAPAQAGAIQAQDTVAHGQATAKKPDAQPAASA
ncbi:hypothetical protein FJZ26_03795 [Candidatus Parvarchaeota archaeon]|nr:hypothetical protein [Candidatus Parvarchaeota archaeon]